MTTTSLYSDTSVKEINSSDFNNGKLTFGKEGFLMCYAHWCPHCRKHLPMWLTLAEIVNNSNNNFVIASFDCMEENNKKLLKQLNITRFPTLFYFGKDGTLYPFQEELTSDNLVKYMQNRK
jgi:thiol-disulfide isomerase/thioredoxin